ncbi:hypothetical protein KX852_05915 [Pseudomonas aeruginosa]|uniref:hypothetical protein n=1 Tax=Pseudomonas aeruginosa TaxID=287 RepID=UPI001C5297AB|nr:hypothetical protein [Pseudomonas aeruginosa]MBW0795199.1 hypothetical protein [Pseudomonas aeruginosa]
MSAEKPRERPILFNDQMVRAILDGRKTVTRRVMKPQPVLDGHFWTYGGAGWSDRINSLTPVAGHSLAARCPYGQPGDRLWVREAWACTLVAQAPGEEWVVYREGDNRTDCGGPWKPSIHMPRWASRILLEITAVRVERLQDISEEQARAEGYPAERECETGGSGLDAWLWFRSLWGEINGPEAFTANPWVWVIEFKRVTP